jgi:hypothetical protein
MLPRNFVHLVSQRVPRHLPSWNSVNPEKDRQVGMRGSLSLLLCSYHPCGVLVPVPGLNVGDDVLVLLGESSVPAKVVNVACRLQPPQVILHRRVCTG